MQLHLSTEILNKIEYTKVEFSSDTKKSLVYDFRASLKEKQIDELIDIKGQGTFLAKTLSVISLREKLIFYRRYENLNISFDKKIEAIFRSYSNKG